MGNMIRGRARRIQETGGPPAPSEDPDYREGGAKLSGSLLEIEWL